MAFNWTDAEARLMSRRSQTSSAVIGSADQQQESVDAAEQRRDAPGIGEQAPLVDEAVLDLAPRFSHARMK